MKLTSVVIMALIGYCVCTDKGSMPMYGGGGGYGGGYGQSYSHVSYAPVYHIKAVDSYAVDLPQYYFKNDFKAYMPILKYYPVQSESYYPSYGGGYGGGY